MNKKVIIIIGITITILCLLGCGIVWIVNHYTTKDNQKVSTSINRENAIGLEVTKEKETTKEDEVHDLNQLVEKDIAAKESEEQEGGNAKKEEKTSSKNENNKTGNAGAGKTSTTTTNNSTHTTTTQEKLEAPELYNITIAEWQREVGGTYIPELSNGKYGYDIGIKKDKYRSSDLSVTKADGYVIYEKTSSGNKTILDEKINGAEAIYIEIEPGQAKAYIARVYKLDAAGKRNYSAYSKELVINMKKPEAPVLYNATVETWKSEGGTGVYIPELVNGKYVYDIGILKNKYRSSDLSITSVTGYVIYEKTSSGNKVVIDEKINGAEATYVEIDPQEAKSYVARAYAVDTKGNRHYSDYSNVLNIARVKQ